MARKTRSYTPQEQAAALAALAANAGNVSRTAAETGVPRNTLAEWAKRQAAGPAAEPAEDCSAPKKGAGRHPAEPVQPAELERAKGVLADELEAAVRAMVPLLRDPQKLQEAKLRDIATAAGILIDKTRLLRDQPTSINANGLTDEQRASRVAELVKLAGTRRAGATSNGVHAPAVAPAAGAADARV